MKRIVSFVVGIVAMSVPAMVFAEQAAQGAAPATEGSVLLKAALAIASGFAIAIATVGGALGQGKVAATAMEGIARNPAAVGKVMTPMIIALALIESLVIYTLVIAILLQLKI